ncbi:hypothetical protein [Bradyrhizobium liaoningense]
MKNGRRTSAVATGKLAAASQKDHEGFCWQTPQSPLKKSLLIMPPIIASVMGQKRLFFALT